jgi:hypothetical protein
LGSPKESKNKQGGNLVSGEIRPVFRVSFVNLLRPILRI